MKILIGGLIELLMFFPLTSMGYLFRKTRKRYTRFQKLKETINLIAGRKITNFRSQNYKRFILPWWFKILLYTTCFLSMIFSIVFTIIKGEYYSII